VLKNAGCHIRNKGVMIFASHKTTEEAPDEIILQQP